MISANCNSKFAFAHFYGRMDIMTITTGTNIEGKTIVEYKGLVFSKGVTKPVNLFLEDKKHYQTYVDWVEKLERDLEASAHEVGANAIIGVRQETLYSGDLNNAVLMLLGTAVIVE